MASRRRSLADRVTRLAGIVNGAADLLRPVLALNKQTLDVQFPDRPLQAKCDRERKGIVDIIAARWGWKVAKEQAANFASLCPRSKESTNQAPEASERA
jgi:hypothetical protein